MRRVLVARKVYGHLAVIKAEKENKDKRSKERRRRNERDQRHARNESEHAAYAQCARWKLLVNERRLLAVTAAVASGVAVVLLQLQLFLVDCLFSLLTVSSCAAAVPRAVGSLLLFLTNSTSTASTCYL